MKLRIEKNWLLITMIAALPVLAADGLNVKTGTWETTITTKSSGMGGMAMPEAAMANMTPEQRAQMAAMMKQMGQGAPNTTTDRSCVTDKDLKDGAFREMQKDSKCTYKQLSGTGNRQEMTFECPTGQGVSSGHMVVNAADNANVRGTMHIKAQGMTIESTFTSKWISAGCDKADK